MRIPQTSIQDVTYNGRVVSVGGLELFLECEQEMGCPDSTSRRNAWPLQSTFAAVCVVPSQQTYLMREGLIVRLG